MHIIMIVAIIIYIVVDLAVIANFTKNLIQIHADSHTHPSSLFSTKGT